MPAPRHYPVRLTQAQRKVVAEIVPDLADRLKLDEPDQRTIEFTVAELEIIQKQAAAGVPHAGTGMKRNSLRHVADLTFQALDRSQGIGSIPVAVRLYQFEITLEGIAPPIWRRIQVRDCTLDRLHEYIQTAMGWTNSHLHHFKIDERNTATRTCCATTSFAEMASSRTRPARRSATSCRSRANGSGSSTSTTSATGGSTRSCSRAASGPSGVAGIRSAWRAHGPARPKTWAAPQATRNTWRRWPIPATSATTSSWGGVARSIRKPSTRRRRRRGCSGGCRTGDVWREKPLPTWRTRSSAYFQKCDSQKTWPRTWNIGAESLRLCYNPCVWKFCPAIFRPRSPGRFSGVLIGSPTRNSSTERQGGVSLWDGVPEGCLQNFLQRCCSIFNSATWLSSSSSLRRRVDLGATQANVPAVRG